MVFLKAKKYKLEKWFKVKGGEYYARNNDLTCKIRVIEEDEWNGCKLQRGKTDMEEKTSAGTT